MQSGWGMTTIQTSSCPLLTVAIMTVFMCCGQCSHRQSPSSSARNIFPFSTPLAYKGLDTSTSPSLALTNKHQFIKPYRRPESRLFPDHNVGTPASSSLFSSTLIITSTTTLLAQLSRKTNNNDYQNTARPRIVKNAPTHPFKHTVNSKSIDSNTNNNHSIDNKTTNNGKFFDDDQGIDPNNDLLVRKLHLQPVPVETVTRQTQLQQIARCTPLNESFVLTNDSESCRTCQCEEDVVASALTTMGFTTAASLDETDRRDVVNENPHDVSSRATITTTNNNNNIASNNESLAEENDDQLNKSPPRCMWVSCNNGTFGGNESYSNNKDAFKVGKCLIAVACVIAFLSIFGLFFSVHRFCERRGHFQLTSSEEDMY